MKTLSSLKKGNLIRETKQKYRIPHAILKITPQH